MASTCPDARGAADASCQAESGRCCRRSGARPGGRARGSRSARRDDANAPAGCLPRCINHPTAATRENFQAQGESVARRRHARAAGAEHHYGRSDAQSRAARIERARPHSGHQVWRVTPRRADVAAQSEADVAAGLDRRDREVGADGKRRLRRVVVGPRSCDCRPPSPAPPRKRAGCRGSGDDDVDDGSGRGARGLQAPHDAAESTFRGTERTTAAWSTLGCAVTITARSAPSRPASSSQSASPIAGRSATCWS